MIDHRESDHRSSGPALDPVCGMKVDPARTPHHAEHDGRDYHFCGAGCQAKFQTDPDVYLAAATSPPNTAAGRNVPHVCPMHPEVRQDGPGACPICGMALEPETPSAGEGPNPELADMTRRFWVGLALGAPVAVLEMGSHFGLDPLRTSGHDLSRIAQLALATPVVLWAGWPLLVRGWTSLATRRLNMFSLIALGVGAAWLASVVGTVAPGLFPRNAGGKSDAPVYFEAAATITVLALLGQVLELRARERTSEAIRALLNLAPRTALRVGVDGQDETIPLEQVRVGDLLRVRPGETVPVDGEVVEGLGQIDESMVTGEAMPVARGSGAPVTGGTLNRAGAFVMRADRVGADTLLARIVRMVAEAQRSRAAVQGLADRVSAWFTPAVVLAALVTAGVWAAVGPEPRLAHALAAAISVLVIACPCALGLATPMSIMVGVGRGAQAGVLIRDAQALERLETVDTLVIDKTGTLTEGRPRLTSILPAPGVDQDDLLRLAASLERASEHPLADAILREAAARDLALSAATDFAATAGKGVRGRVDGRAVVVGKSDFLREQGQDLGAMEAQAEAMRADGAVVVFVGVDNLLAGLLVIADPIKASAAEALGALRTEGLRIVMITGDHRSTAAVVARALGVDEVEAEVLPQDKAEAVRRLREAGRRVAMAGDGINDGPALAAADVGVAMGGGSDVAIESAGITLLGGDLNALVRARRLSRAVMRNIRQNLFFAFVYNIAGVPIAAGALYPLFGALLPPQAAAAAMALSSVSVIANALRLRSVRL